MADALSDVIRIDPPNGPRSDHPANAMLQRGKRSTVVDLTQQDSRTRAQRLTVTACVVIENFRPGVASHPGVRPETSMATNPRLIYCSIPGFGHGDPRDHTKAWDGVILAAAGIYVSKTPDSRENPVFSAVPYASSFGATLAARTTMATLAARKAGQRFEIPLSSRCLRRSATSVSASSPRHLSA